MTNEIIAKFCETQKITSGNCVRIDFKKRNPILGLIVVAGDYDDLKSKNFWRIVVRANMEAWQRTKNIEMAKIYNGSEFTRLSVVSEKEMV